MSETPTHREGEIDLFELLIKLWEGKWTIILAVIGAAILGMLYSITLPSSYSGSTLVRAAQQSNKVSTRGVASVYAARNSRRASLVSVPGAWRQWAALTVAMSSCVAAMKPKEPRSSCTDHPTPALARALCRNSNVPCTVSKEQLKVSSNDKDELHVPISA